MPALYRDGSLASEDNTLLPKSEKHVSFDPELQHRELENVKSKQKQRVTRRLHTFGLILLFLGLLFYSHAGRVSASRYLAQQQLTTISILAIPDKTQP